MLTDTWLGERATLNQHLHLALPWANRTAQNGRFSSIACESGCARELLGGRLHRRDSAGEQLDETRRSSQVRSLARVDGAHTGHRAEEANCDLRRTKFVFQFFFSFIVVLGCEWKNKASQPAQAKASRASSKTHRRTASRAGRAEGTINHWIFEPSIVNKTSTAPLKNEL